MKDLLHSLNVDPDQLVYVALGLVFLLCVAYESQRFLAFHRERHMDDYRRPCYKCGTSHIYYLLKKLPDTTYHKDRWFCPACYMELTEFKRRK